MVEKLNYGWQAGGGYIEPTRERVCDKINEIVDVVNELQTKVNKMAQNPNFAQPEVKELERTRRALEIAVDALKDNLSQANFREMLDASRFHCIRTKCEFALAEITALEQKE